MMKVQPLRDDDLSAGLADAMKAQTWEQHKIAERTGFMADMFRSRASLKDYTLFKRNLLPIYETIEGSLAALEPFPSMQLGFPPALHRARSLRHDLSQMVGGDGFQGMPCLKATRDYCAAIKHSVADEPAAILGHIYVRYLGDLYGGQTLSKVLQKTLSLPPSSLTFYDFRAAGELIDVRSRFRHALNTLDVTEPQRVAAVDAALAGFQGNIALSEAVAAYSA